MSQCLKPKPERFDGTLQEVDDVQRVPRH